MEKMIRESDGALIEITKRTEITIGDRTHTGYQYDVTVGSFTFPVVVYKNGGVWRVSTPTGAWIDSGVSRAVAIANCRERLDRVGEDRVRFQIERGVK